MTWSFTFDQGTVDTRRVQNEIQGSAKGGTGSTALVFNLEPSEVQTVEESLGYLGAVATREVPDGESFVEDNSSGSTNEVDISPPNTDIMPSGTYVVEGFETRTLNNAFYEVTLRVSLLSADATQGFGTNFGHDFGS